MEIFQLRAGEDFIRLGQVLKATGMAESGAEAKEIIQTALSASTVRPRREEEESSIKETSFHMTEKSLRSDDRALIDIRIV